MNRFCKAVTKKVRNEKAILFDSLTELRDKLNRDLVICEIGSGNGMNFKHYPRGSKLICVEPNQYTRSYLEQNIRDRNPSLTLKEFICGFAENMPGVDDDSVDVVVCTLVLCSVKSQKKVLSEVLRILRPDGQFYFMEHVADRPGTFRRKMQNWFTPAWQVVADRCRLNSDARVALDEAGFTSVRITDFAFPTWFWLIKPWMYGVATK
ncbi:methyltransferase-like protein 7A isoform X1 [Gigantopelta aegis]|uniref:methyltransferase-like protein 7A isoform X1 n=1 Tax=Gigantopelta aegis TaxID=1735272 RepID=UPI001B88A4A9|nr:methyltransferase-like protein 7A isoform X1 [Gigantopelta aegis]